ncbi:methyltransferase [Candidatus Woesearchaeota archaeon]|nr:methyltransferase [Candidatus Woesearchaeota archaeon]
MKPLTPEQQAQLQKQIEAHKEIIDGTGEGYVVYIHLGFEDFEFAVYIYEGVMRADQMTSAYLARYLSWNNELYAGKTAIDMGCGCGLLGLVMARYGAERVIMSDISPEAVKNTKDNLRMWKGSEQRYIKDTYEPVKGGLLIKYLCEVVQGDLFENINEKADLIVFNHPFFDGYSSEAPFSMASKGDTLERFLEQAKDYLFEDNSRIIMPFYHVAPEDNDPGIQGPKHGYKVKTMRHFDAKKGMQQGPVSIYELSK